MTNVLTIREVKSRRYGTLRLQAEYVGGAVALLDTAVNLVASQIAYVGYSLAIGDPSRDALHYLGIGLIFNALFVLCARSRGAYSRDNLTNQWRQLRVLTLVHGGVFAFLALTAFTLKIGNTFSRGGILTFGLCSLIGILANHAWWIWKVRQSSRTGHSVFAPRRVLLIGSDDTLLREKTISQLQDNGFETVHAMVMPDRSASRDAVQSFFRNVSAMAKQRNAKEIMIVSRWRHIPFMLRSVEDLRVLPLSIRLVVDPFASDVARRPVQQIGDLITVEMQRAPMSWSEIAIKRGIDIVISGTALLVLSPLLVLTALAVKLDSRGPALFKQARLGFNGVPFKILKFRSMRVLEDGERVVQASRGDSRVTRVGRFIRRTSIDELPQLWNILRGDMSLVGPRPHAIAHDNHYEKHLSDYAFRQHVKPGLSGWAQVNGSRGETPTLDCMARRVSLDIWYINNRSLLLDLKILAMTALQLIRNKHIY